MASIHRQKGITSSAPVQWEVSGQVSLRIDPPTSSWPLVGHAQRCPTNRPLKHKEPLLRAPLLSINKPGSATTSYEGTRGNGVGRGFILTTWDKFNHGVLKMIVSINIKKWIFETFARPSQLLITLYILGLFSYWN